MQKSSDYRERKKWQIVAKGGGDKQKKKKNTTFKQLNTYTTQMQKYQYTHTHVGRCEKWGAKQPQKCVKNYLKMPTDKQEQ